MSKPKKQPKPEGAVAKTEVPAPKTPPLSASLKAQADRLIAARDGKKVPTKTDRKRGEPEEETVVFAFRLSAEERELIHKAAGPAKASRFVRTLVVAAAKRDEAVVRELLATVSWARCTTKPPESASGGLVLAVSGFHSHDAVNAV